MLLTDPIADLLTRVRNAARAKHRTLRAPASKVNRRLAELLKREGYLTRVDFVKEGPQGYLEIEVAYDSDNQPVLSGVRRMSRPGLRRYASSDGIPRVRAGLGTVILSTSRGLMTGAEARKQHIGGELICSIW
ncbi:MAG: 30S ribosomal protein S8 [Myxococcota bacterium]|nr:30S ribosomal protein S8 [Myxococcota bacterium]